MSPRKGTNTKETKKNRRAEILQVSLDLFHRKGYESTPIHEIAGEVGTSSSNVHYHFRHKEDIVRALFEPSFDRVEALLEQVEEVEDRDELLEGYLEIMLEDRKLATLLAIDVSILSIPEIWNRAQTLMLGLRRNVAGEGAEPEEVIKSECALGVLRSGVISVPEYDASLVRKIALPAALALLDSE